MNLQAAVHKEFRTQLHSRLNHGYRYSPGSLPSAWHNCIDNVAVHTVWDMFEAMHVVEIHPEPDDLSIDDLLGDCYEEYHADTIPGGLRELRAQKKRVLDKLDQEGQWIQSSRVQLPGQPWKEVGSIGGFIGLDDFECSGYLPGMQVAALDALADYYRAPRWRDCCEDVRQRAFVFMSALALCGADMPHNWQERTAWPLPSVRK